MNDIWMAGFLQRCAQRGLDPAKVMDGAQKSAAATDAALGLGRELSGKPMPSASMMNILKPFAKKQRMIGAAKFGVPAAIIAAAVTQVINQRGQK